MMPSTVNPLNANDSTMPGDYESWPTPGARGGLLGDRSPPSPQPMIPSARTPFPRIPPAEPTPGLTGRTPFPRLPPTVPPVGLRRRRPPMVPRIRLQRSPRRRRRPVIPDIVIERRHHHHSSRGRHRVITIPLDHRPTLGLRGPPTRVIEIERIPCRRHRKSSKICYEYEYDDPPPRLLPPQPPSVPAQPTIMIANPVANSSVPANQPTLTLSINNTPAASAHANFLSNLSAETINSLPRQTVHLPPIHLPGTHADANTELETIIFPAEIINPIDGSLSVIQANPGINTAGTANIQSISAAPIQPQLINIVPTAGIPAAPSGSPVSPAMTADPVMNRFRDLFQRLNISQRQPTPSAPNLSAIRPTLPSMSQFVPRSNPMNNLSPMSQFTPRNNIMNNLPPMSQFTPRNNITNNLPPMSQFDPGTSTVNNRPIIPSMNTANIGNYPSVNTQLTNTLNTGSYRPTSTTPMIPSNITPSASVNNMSYRPAAITPYQTSNFASSPTANNTTYRPSNIAPSDLSDIGPYRPANITPYANIANRSNNNPLSQSSFSSRPAGYSSAPPVESTSTFTPFPRLSSLPPEPGVDSINPSSSSLTTPSNQSLSSTPKSILRNTTSTALPNTNTYSQLGSPSIMSSDDMILKATRFA